MTELLELISGKDTLFVGVGNVLKGDDGAGVFLASLIRERDRIRTLVVETGIENHIGKINALAPALTVIIDAAHLDQQAGKSLLIDPKESVNTTTHTHNISLRNLVRFFEMPCIVLGVQPANLQLGAPMSPEVLRTCCRIAGDINAQHALFA